MHRWSNVLYKYVKIMTQVLDVILLDNFCIFMTCIWYDSFKECCEKYIKIQVDIA